jgi:3-hydroxyacyl-CoA dehydrogenase
MGYTINRVAVIGAGTMGAAIAAHLANVGIVVYLLDVVPQELTPKEEAQGMTLDHPTVRNRIVNEGWRRCLEAHPASLFAPDVAERVTLGNLNDNLDWVGQADWIVESVIERLDVKQQIMARIEGSRKPSSIVSTNTSGIPVKDIAYGRSDEFKAHFLGIHFFNPPRYLKLLEVIPLRQASLDSARDRQGKSHEQTQTQIVEFMQEFGTRTLGKGVVVCKDTPNFIVNRFMSFSEAYTLNYALDNGYTVEQVDALTGPILGRPETATLRLYDLIGIDVMSHINGNLYPAIPHDPYREELEHEKSSALIKTMMKRNWLGNKTGQGFYKRVETEAGHQLWALNLETMEYQPTTTTRFGSVEAHKGVTDVGERIKRLCAGAWAQPDRPHDRAGQFIWATLAFALNYAASVVPEIADHILSIDRAVKWGLNHALGPFEIWDALGVAESVERMEADGITVTPWVKEMLAAGHTSFYRTASPDELLGPASKQDEMSGMIDVELQMYDPGAKRYVPVEADPRAIVLKDIKATPQPADRVIASTPSASLVNLGDGVLALEFHSMLNALDMDTLQMIVQAREELEKGWAGLVIGNQGEHFCIGASLVMLAQIVQQGEWEKLEGMIKTLQDVLMAFRYSPKPVVSAPFGMTLGGGAEVMMGSSAVCAAAESYIGQVEAGVGLVPAAGGCKELVRRVVSPVIKYAPNADPLPFMQRIFEMLTMAKMSASAEEARQWGFLTPADRIIMNQDHLLYEAKRMVLEMVESVYRPPVRGKEIWAVGADDLTTLEMMVRSAKEAGIASEHDALIANKTAYVLCGGKLAMPQWVDPQHILDLEREVFLSLLGEPKTIDRVWHMLKMGTVLRN